MSEQPVDTDAKRSRGRPPKLRVCTGACGLEQQAAAFRDDDPICRKCKAEEREQRRAEQKKLAQESKIAYVVSQPHMMHAVEHLDTKRAIAAVGVAVQRVVRRAGTACACCGSMSLVQLDDFGNAWCRICRHYIEAVGQCVFHFGPVVYPERQLNPLPPELPLEIILPPLPPAPELPAVLPPEEA